MPSQKTQKAARRRAQADVYANPPGGVGGGIPGGPIDNTAGTQKITWGTVETFAVDANRLTFDLNAGAQNKPRLSVATDAPHFDAAVSMAQTAYQNQAENMMLTVRFLDPDRRLQIGERIVFPALELAIGNYPAGALTLVD